MAADGPDVPPERRAMLADKGRRLYDKYCGTGGRGICSESFAAYHIGRGEAVVAADPEGRRAMTAGLIERIRRHLAEAGGA